MFLGRRGCGGWVLLVGGAGGFVGVSWVVCIMFASGLVVFRFVLGCLCFLCLLFRVVVVLVFLVL